MAWRKEKRDGGQDLIWDGAQNGIAASPLLGNANIQNANIATESGEVVASYGRTSQTQAAISGGTLTASVGDGATLLAAPSTLKAGTWIRVTASTISSISAATNPATVSISYLAVGGGGGAGGSSANAASGGGAGGQVSTGTSTVSAGSYSITVGGGGAGGSGTTQGTTGSSTVISSIVTAVGGSGGGAGSTNQNGVNGTNGGGAGADGGGAGTGGTGTNKAGGNGSSAGAVYNGGGGAGNGAVGGNAAAGPAGAGGAGTASSITGTSVTYGGGGGGGTFGGTAGAGGSGGGASGVGPQTGNSGTANTGGGGGGCSGVNTGGSGGSGIAVISYTTGAVVATGGDVTVSGTKTIHTFRSNGTFTVLSIPTGGLYFVSYKDANNKVKLSANFDPTSSTPLTHGTSGTATFDVVAVPNSAIAKATEPYTTSATTEYRYYVLDANGYTWVYDTAVYDSTLSGSGVGTTWMLPDPTNYSTLNFGGMAVLNGWLQVVSPSRVYAKPTTNLGSYFYPVYSLFLNEPFKTHSNFAQTGHQGKMRYCDGNYIGEIFPTTSLVTSIANIQSNCKYTASGTTGTISYVIDGSLPYSPDGTRIPVVFYTDQYGALPTAIVGGTVYFVSYNAEAATFSVYTAATGGSAVDISTGASGNQFFNTYYPISYDASPSGSHPLVQISSQRLNLPQFETAQTMVEIGNIVLIGCTSNTIYPWNQVDSLPSDIISLPESNVKTMINVNNMAYIFAGAKGNVYISNGSIASLALKVPDYCAGVPGTPLTYIEPYFTWGDAEYVRGRVYFSILDQTATKAGNCGGIWSFIPSQNVDPMQNVGMALRLENQNSYGTYSGYATIILGNQEQESAVSPQYWAWWQDSYSTGTSSFGVDATASTPVTQFIVETDAVPTGTFLYKETFQQIEYKLATPMQTNDAVQLYYRLNPTDAWTSCGTVGEETTNRISGFFNVNFQKTQWLQFRAVCTTGGTTSSSFIRLTEIRFR